MSGMEGPGMMAGETCDPERTMRRAGWIASGFAAAFYISATAAMLVVLPPEKITELNGFAEMGVSAGRLLGAAWLLPLIALLVLVSGVGFVGGVGTAASRLPFAAGVDGLLPKAFSTVHPRWGTPYVATLALGLAATFLLIVYQLGDTVRAAYDELVSLMVITGFIPYLYIFASAWKAGKRLSAAFGLAVGLGDSILGGASHGSHQHLVVRRQTCHRNAGRRSRSRGYLQPKETIITLHF
jgi:glutamate:GABA antiporter